MSDEDIIRLRHMLDAAREAAGFLCGRDSDDLRTNRMLQLALIKELEIIGEAASRISEATRAEIEGIPWPKIIGMRHRVIHAYAEVNLSILWDTLTIALPELAKELEKIIEA